MLCRYAPEYHVLIIDVCVIMFKYKILFGAILLKHMIPLLSVVIITSAKHRDHFVQPLLVFILLPSAL